MDRFGDNQTEGFGTSCNPRGAVGGEERERERERERTYIIHFIQDDTTRVDN